MNFIRLEYLLRYKNIFVLSTGRCGSTAFAKACSHFLNYSVGHETRTRFLGVNRFKYPNYHIEVDNRLSWLLGRLDINFGADAYYVHLTRNSKDTAKSYSKRKLGIMQAYQGGGIIMHCREKDQLLIAKDYVETVTANIENFLINKKNKMSFKLENFRHDFPQFCSQVKAEVDMERASLEFCVMHNSSE